MIQRILCKLFPPKIRVRVDGWRDRIEFYTDDQGSASPAQPKKYANGIERHFAENGHFIDPN